MNEVLISLMLFEVSLERISDDDIDEAILYDVCFILRVVIRLRLFLVVPEIVEIRFYHYGYEISDARILVISKTLLFLLIKLINSLTIKSVD